MDATDLVERFRSDVDDLEKPYLWTDDDVYRYIDEAQKDLVRGIGGIHDASSQLTSLTLRAGAEFTPYNDRILKIRSIRRRDDGRFLELMNFEDVEYSNVPTFDDYGEKSPRISFLSEETGEVRGIILGMEPYKLRPWRIPETDLRIRLIVDRLPEKQVKRDQVCMEVEDHHFEGLLHGMKFRAYSKQDAETFDKGAAESHSRFFQAYILEAKAEKERREHKPRSVSYGGL